MESDVNMPDGILESLLSGESKVVAHVQPMYRLLDNRLVAKEYLARHVDAEGVIHAGRTGFAWTCASWKPPSRPWPAPGMSGTCTS